MLNVLISKRQSLFKFFDFSVVLASIALTFLIFARIFFSFQDYGNNLIFNSTRYIMIYFIAQELVRLVLTRSFFFHIKNRWIELLIALSASIVTFLSKDHFESFTPFGFKVSLYYIEHAYLGYIGIVGALAFLTQAFRLFRQSKIVKYFSFNSTQIFILSFFIPIVIGTVFLKLPNSTIESISWIEAAYTAVSAICVTGLTIVDMSQFSFTGQIVVFFLFQAGGIGIMTFTIFFAQIFTGQVNMKEKILLSKLLSSETISEVKDTLIKICTFTIVLEIVGAVFLYILTPEGLLGSNNRVWISVFHSVSAFCNAGFSLFSDSLSGDLFKNSMGFSAVISVLIIFGGLGFPVLRNLQMLFKNMFNSKKNYRILTVNTKLILIITPILLIAGTVFIFLSERSKAFADLNTMEALFHSYFFSVTSRTAGFNSFSLESLGIISTTVIMLLMWIGAAPMSTGGGIKSTTFAISILHLWNQIRGLTKIKIFNREISSFSLRRALSTIFASVLLLVLAIIALFYFEPSLPPQKIVFEAISAWGTVGLSKGISADMSKAGQSIIIALMFIGRVGVFSFLTVLVSQSSHKENNIKFLEEEVTIY